MSKETLAGNDQDEPDTATSIAIVGMACRLPGAKDSDALWELLSAGRSAIQPIPAQRWDVARLHDPERKTPGRTVNRQAGLIDEIDGFDATFFGISAREARAMDPQQRLLLEETWHALEDAGLAPEALRGQRVGVYVGAMANDYLQHAASPFREPDAYSTMGVYAALLANRLSAFFGWRGESVTVDTACASSLAALHQARLALLGGTVDYCIVAAANALISPWKVVSFSQAGMLSGDGLCKTFAEGADGYVPGEGAVVLVLRRAREAIQEDDRIHGLLLGTALNHMGPGSGITAPSVEAEAEVIRSALREARVPPQQITYVECHGTGTALGDPIEVEALARVIVTEDPAGEGSSLLIGSIKTNIGHLEAAAGLAGVAKLLLMMRHGMIPPTVNLERDNPLIDFRTLPFTPARKLAPWPSRPRIAGVSAYGFGGAGGHAILAEPPLRRSANKADSQPDATQPALLAISAQDEPALKQMANNLATCLESRAERDLASIARALAANRGSLKYRMLISAQHRAEAIANLRQTTMPIRRQPEQPPRLTLRLLDAATMSAWRSLRNQVPGLEPIASALAARLREAGFDTDHPTLAQHIEIRSLISLLRECGIQPQVLHAFGACRPAALAEAGVLSEEAAARLAESGRLDTYVGLRPTIVYRDGETGLELVPVRPAQDALERLLPAVASDRGLLELGQRLWRSNYTFRAHCDEWRDTLGYPPGERLLVELSGMGMGLCLAVASALWATCARWSLRPPLIAAQWPAWPLAALVADGWVSQQLALEVLQGTRPLADLARVLARPDCLPDTRRHPWLEEQRTHLPEFDGLASPLSGKSVQPSEEATDLVLVIGAESRQPNSPSAEGRLIWLDPAGGLASLEQALAKLWFAGLDVHQRALALPRSHLDLPLYPFNRKSYWLPRLPEGKPVVIWETGQILGEAGHAQMVSATPKEVTESPSGNDADLASVQAESRDWVECIRQCVADTLEADAGDIDLHQPLDRQGIDSLISMDLAARIERECGVKLSPAVVEQLGSVQALAERVAQTVGSSAPPPTTATNAPSSPTTAPAELAETQEPLTTAGTLTPPAQAQAAPRDWMAVVRQCVADTLEADIADIDLHRPLDTQGIDSLISMDLSTRIERETGVKLSPAVVEQLGSVAALAQRIAQEFASAPPTPILETVAAPRQSEALAVRVDTPGLLDSIGLSSRGCPAPGAGQVKVRIRAAGINFRDLMMALDALPDARGEPLGLEFCGKIEALGPGVEGIAVGDRVLGIAFGALAESVVTEAGFVVPAPLGLVDAAAAGLPIVYLTVLNCLAGLQPGQSLLIHAAAGGLGQAAVQLARAVGARIFATAGSPEKRAWLESQDIEQVMDSRGLDFAQEVLAATGGQGVDWVLNSLTGAAIDRGMDCLAPGGVFVEVGKTDLRNPEEVARYRPDIHYRIYDLVAEVREQPAKVARSLKELARRLGCGELPPLAYETFPMTEARAAFRQMAKSQHRGKLVLLADTAAFRHRSPKQAEAKSVNMPMAVVGLAGRFPGAADTAALWELLEAGRCAIGEVPAGRWSTREMDWFAHGLTDSSQLTQGGFLDDAENFDHAFFGLSPREARATDPRQRLLLEETWKALHAAGLHWNRSDSSLSHADIGVFVAADAGDYGFKRAALGVKGDQLALAGNLPSSLAARLAHTFDCTGPALTLDLACSSSLGALWAAQQALERGDCRYAVVAAVSLHATPLLTAQLGAAGLLSATGRCQPFTVEADGFVPAEACVALVLKPLDSARADGDRVHAVIRDVAVIHDGQGDSFTLPSADSLARLQAMALARAGLTPAEIDLISAHGVGTRGGDSAEMTALIRTFDAVAKPLPVTTLKPRLGHTLAAAGLSAVVHAILQIQHNRLLPVGLEERNLIPEWDSARFHLPTTATPWPVRADGQPRRVLVNTFAINGGQGAAIVEEAPADLVRSPPAPPAHQLARRRFWLDEAVTKSHAPDIPGPASPSADRTEATPESARPTAEDHVLNGLRTELAELLREPPANLDFNAAPIALGLSSILGIELQHRLRRRFGITLNLADLLGVGRMIDLVPRLNAGPGLAATATAMDDPEPFAPFPLTDLQAAYWSGRQPDVPLGGVDCQVYWEFECARNWPIARLESAWNQLVAIHPMLRAVVDSHPRQRVLPDAPPYRFETLDLRESPPALAAQRLETLRQELSTATLDPDSWPLFRLAVSYTAEHCRLHCVVNLLVMDVLSLFTLLDQLALLAENPSTELLPPNLTYKQCLEAQRAALETQEWQAAERFWAERGPALPPAPALPITRSLASHGRLTTRRLQARLSDAEWLNLSRQAKSHDISASVALLSAFAGTLAHWSEKPDFTLNLTTHTRPPLHPDINQVIGNFTSTVLLDVAVRSGQPFRELAVRTGHRLLEHLDRAVYPGVLVLRRRAATLGWGAGLMPVVFTSMLGYESLRQADKKDSALQIGTLRHGATRTPQVTLDAQVQLDGEGLLLSWDVADSVFPDGMPEAMFQAWVNTARALATPEGWEVNPTTRISNDEAQVRRRANGDVGPAPDDALFAPMLRQATGYPDRIAIIAPDRTLSYREVAGLCADFAAHLRSLDVQPGELVAVAMEKGWRQIVAAIAVQMAGAAYLPLAPDLPAARFAQLVERGGVRIGLTEAGRPLDWPAGIEIIPIDPAVQPTTHAVELPEIDPDSLAYVIFTSGSTGEPKGVMLTHRAALNTCLDINRRFGIGPRDRVLGLSALSFDLSVWDIFGTLAAGGAVVLPKPASANDPAYLAEVVSQQRVSVWNSVPMYLELFLAGEPAPESLTSLRIVMLSGDWIALGLAGRLRALSPQAQVHSLGGATEAAIWSIHYPIDATPRPGWNSVPYGRALDNQAMHILDAQLAPTPDGVAGDLYIGGIGLALGYWRDPERTAAAFITHPESGERLYRTGDLARWREEGLIEFLGRRDGQVKIDGFRVELGEIEAVLRGHPAVREAVAVAPTDEQGKKRLAAFCLTDTAIAPDGLLTYLRERIPRYMVPKALRILDSLPLTDNEKVDRRALADMAFRGDSDCSVPQTGGNDADALESRLLTLWAAILGQTQGLPDAQRNLFELGADSLMAVIASRRIAAELGVPCTVTDIFEHATIARLAKALSVRSIRPAVSAPRLIIDGDTHSRADLRKAFRSIKFGS